MRFLRLLLVLSLCSFVTLPAYAQDVAEKPSKAISLEGSKGLFWEAHSKTGTVYLLGSIHMADLSVYPLAKGIEQAFADSSALAVEADVAGDQTALQAKMLALGMYQKGSLPKHISKTTYAGLQKCLTSLNVEPTKFDQFKPWMVALVLTSIAAQKAGLDPNLGLDMHFLTKAHKGSKTIVELEGVDSQFAMFESMSPKLQEALLRSSVKEMEHFDEQLKKMVKAWKTGNAEATSKLIQEGFDDSPDMKPMVAVLFTDRNKLMADKAAEFLESDKTTFVVVGAGHLVGPTGVVKLLQNKGYKVEQK